MESPITNDERLIPSYCSVSDPNGTLSTTKMQALNIHMDYLPQHNCKILEALIKDGILTLLQCSEMESITRESDNYYVEINTVIF